MFPKYCVRVLVALKKHIEEHYENTCSYCQVYSLLIFDTVVKVTLEEYADSDSSIFMLAQDHNEWCYQLWECFLV